ncbi:hypothetical protein [Erwinia sp. JH02]|uniref:hypothetical protein n=1 Tax=Erwinia sp. JH02 TaxID=2733394 RepID=UPI00148817C9|nr:hypothetical protein [Erwinia sp. JH02]NNS06929.1 hypothetical protein [Erwinia sp. JH02]
MKLELAHSIELGKDISADNADELFQSGTITSKHFFECPEENCHAQVTCANLDKPKKLRKRDPYFKFVSEHRTGCPVEAENDEDLRRVKTTWDDPEALPFICDDMVDLDLSAPNNRIVHDLNTDDDEQGVIKKIRPALADDDEERFKRRHSKKRLSGLVHAFINKENFFLNTAEGKMHLRDFFIKIGDSKDLKYFQDEPRIYFGKAWLNAKENYYLVRFNDAMRSGEVKSRPTFFIPARLIDNSTYRRTSREKLDEIAKASPIKPLYLFIFSELPPVKKNTENYINFKLDDLTYLYFLPWGK